MIKKTNLIYRWQKNSSKMTFKTTLNPGKKKLIHFFIMIEFLKKTFFQHAYFTMNIEMLKMYFVQIVSSHHSQKK